MAVVTVHPGFKTQGNSLEFWIGARAFGQWGGAAALPISSTQSVRTYICG